jgi:hypothetical protein
MLLLAQGADGRVSVNKERRIVHNWPSEEEIERRQLAMAFGVVFNASPAQRTSLMESSLVISRRLSGLPQRAAARGLRTSKDAACSSATAARPGRRQPDPRCPGQRRSISAAGRRTAEPSSTTRSARPPSNWMRWPQSGRGCSHSDVARWSGRLLVEDADLLRPLRVAMGSDLHRRPGPLKDGA